MDKRYKHIMGMCTQSTTLAYHLLSNADHSQAADEVARPYLDDLVKLTSNLQQALNIVVKVQTLPL